MNRSFRLPLVVLIATGCAGGSNNTDADDTATEPQETDVESTDDDTDADEPDDDTDIDPNTAPAIVSMTPVADAAGVMPDATITLAFNVPMDPESVAGALTSVVLGDDLTLSWPDAKTLVITPTKDMPVASWDEEGQGSEVDVGLAQTAKSAAGVAMDGPYWASFRVARSYAVSIRNEDALTGRVSSDDGVSTSTFQVGDTAAGVTHRAVATFDLTGVPAILAVRQTVLQVNMNSYTGTPWASLGALQIAPVRFETLDASVYGAAPIGDAVDGYEPNDDTVLYVPDITSAFETAVAERAEDQQLVQFRLAFATATDDDDGTDYAVFTKDAAGPKLTVDLLVE